VGVASVTTLASSKNPSLVTDSVMFTVHVAPGPNSGSNQTPTGAVVLMDGANMLASGTLDDSGTYTFSTAALTQATHVITANYAGDALYSPSLAMLSQVVNHAPAVAPTLMWATPAAIPYGTALSGAQLNATAIDATGAAVPGVFVYTPAAGTVLNIGTQTLSVTFTPTDLQSFTVATKTVNLLVTGVVVSSFTPTTATLGAGATTVTITGAGFVGNSVVQVNGTAIPTTLVNATTLSAVIPASDFLNVGTLQITVFDPSISVTSAAVQLTVTAPAPIAILDVPPTTQPGTQPTVTLSLSQPYPVDITATVTLSFAASTTPAIDDPNIVFATTGTRTENVTIPAGSVTVPPIALQAGTVAGTITVPIKLTAGGVDVTPTTLEPGVIVVPAAVPAISTVTATRSGNQLTVVVHGFSNTREMVNAKFHFTPAAGASLDTTDLTVTSDLIFNTNWFQTKTSDQYGSTFTYTQIFNTSDDATTVGSVDVTLTNTIGASDMKTTQ
jgi:Bacterial Ig-like domain (group 3)